MRRTRVAGAVVAALALVGASIVVSCSSSEPQPASTGRTVAGYVAPWDPRGASALESPPSPLRELSPVWYQPLDTGAVAFTGEQARIEASRAPARLRTKGVRLVPSVSNFRNGDWDGALVAAILDDPARRGRHVDALATVARQPDVAGIDLDYESLDPGHRDAFSAFVRDLAAALHRLDRKLTVTVHAQTGGPGTSGGARAQDWKALGEAADQVRIMAYDHAWQTSPPGPVAPKPWVESVLRFAVGQIPQAKIFLGLPTYGYDWPDGQRGQDVAWADATAIAKTRGVEQRWDEQSASPWLTYADDRGVPHTVWYEDARSLSAKLELLRRYPVGGVVLWKVGGEDPETWGLLRGVGWPGRGGTRPARGRWPGLRAGASRPAPRSARPGLTPRSTPVAPRPAPR